MKIDPNFAKKAYDHHAAKDYDYSRYYCGFREKLFREFSNQLAFRIVRNLCRDRPDKYLILDFATGTGQKAQYINSIPEVQVVGLDVSFHMLSEAIHSYSRELDSPVLWVNGDGLQLPFKNNTFDHITSFKFLHIMENYYHYDFLIELQRILKPGGQLIMDCGNGFFHILNSIRLRKIWRRHSRFYWPHHRYTLYKDFHIVNIVGEWVFFTSFFWKLSPKFAVLMNRLANYFPFKYLCGKLVLFFQKKG